MTKLPIPEMVALEALENKSDTKSLRGCNNRANTLSRDELPPLRDFISKRGDHRMIYINSTMRIQKFDEKNLQIQVLKRHKNRKTKDVTDEWVWDGYYTKLEDAFLAAYRKLLVKTPEEDMDIKGAIEKIEMAKLEILRAVNSLKEEL